MTDRTSRAMVSFAHGRLPAPAGLKFSTALFALALALTAAPAAKVAEAQTPDVLAEIDRTFDEFRRESHVPGLVYGIVMNGRLVYVKGIGVQDIESRRPVTPETLFRIASMTKSFTALSILKLRDEGRLSLDALVESYVPELRGWKYPTADSPRIRVRDLLSHTAGFVTDDPWGDRQTPLPDADFTRMLQEGVPFARTPGMAMEYSNFGYALLGRVVTNVSGRPFNEFAAQSLLGPLGMTSSGYDVSKSPAERRALGYRWEDDAWRLEPTLAHGAFGAMGGIQTSATDYARYVAWLLSAWPPRDDADAGPVRRASVRELAQGQNFVGISQRPGKSGASACRAGQAYGMGWIVASDCELGLTLNHGGGYPGYGSNVLLLPEFGVGIFAFANRTYAGPRPPVWDAAMALQRAGLLKPVPVTLSDALASAYRVTGAMFVAGSVTTAGDVLAMNFLLDRSAEHWAADLGRLKARLGDCETSDPIVPVTALSGKFSWRCERGRLQGSLLLAPTRPPRIQSLAFSPVDP